MARLCPYPFAALVRRVFRIDRRQTIFDLPARAFFVGGPRKDLSVRFHGRAPAAAPTIYDMSVGYDLAGIKSDRVRAFIRGMLDARVVDERLRNQIPDEYREYLDFSSRLSDTLTAEHLPRMPVRRDREDRRVPAARRWSARHDQAEPDAAGETRDASAAS